MWQALIGKKAARSTFHLVHTAFLLLLAIALPLPSAWSQASAPTVNTSAPPAWVEAIARDDGGTPSPDFESTSSSLVLMDLQVNAVTAERYIHVIKRINNESGVQSGANLSFLFDPSYQKLTIHQIVVRRDGQSVDRLEPDRFKVIQKEPDLDRQVYNGTLSAVLFLDDVRVGDEVEYAYTLSGGNPALLGQYAETFLARFPMPVQRLRHRLLWWPDRTLHYKSSGIIANPRIISVGDKKEYVWDWRNLSAVTYEDRVPAWYPAYPYVKISSSQDWASIAIWADSLFAGTNLDSPEINARIGSLKATNATAEESIRAALDFVQNNVRYLGIEFGGSSFRPTDPATVLHRRFGDCKDKAFLLCTLLHGLGFKAAPVLVNSAYGRTLPDQLPSPDDFDHVIVRVVGDGVTYWVDPTASNQRGPLLERSRPDYGFGLLVSPAETDLIPIPAPESSAPTHTTEVFYITGQKSPVKLTVNSAFAGSDAEMMRAVIAVTGRAALEQDYLNDFAQFYPGTRSLDHMTISESKTENPFSILHQYVITNFWTLSKDKLRYQRSFYALGIHSWITKPTTVNRTLPLEHAYPRRRIVETRLNLPPAFKLSGSTNIIRGPAAQLSVQRVIVPGGIVLRYEYESLTNVVFPAQLAAHLKSLEEMEDVINYSLVWQNLEADHHAAFNWPVLLLVCLYMPACIVALLVIYRRWFRGPVVEPVATVPVEHPHLVGLGGWLILIGINVCCSPLRVLYQLFSSFNLAFTNKWQILTAQSGLHYHPLRIPILYYEFLGQMTLFVMSAFTVILFFQKRRAFPRWFIMMLAFNAIFFVVDVLVVHGLLHDPGFGTKETRIFYQIGFGLFVWVPYMCVSKRVKATFTR